MKMKSRTIARMLKGIAFAAAILALSASCAIAQPTAGPLASWNEALQNRRSWTSFRRRPTRRIRNSSRRRRRIAAFDQDGTLLVEQPSYTQIIFAIDRVAALAPQHPEWKEQEPYKSILNHNREAMAKLSFQDFEMVIAATHSGMTVDEFQSIVKDWLATAKHPRFQRPYTELIYQPMLELMHYLRANGYKTYIVTGGGQEFVRTFAERVYGIPPEQVVGSVEKVKFEIDKNGDAVLMKLPESMLENNNSGKPVGINLMIGRRPRAAFGNSTGDRQMLEYANPAKARLLMLVYHDDAGANTPDGKLEDRHLYRRTGGRGENRGWTVISMKSDWKRIFPFERGMSGPPYGFGGMQ